MEHRINIEAIEGIASQVRIKHEEILSIVSELHMLNNELDGAWDGEAQMEFEARFGEWIGQLEQYSGTLDSVDQFLLSLVQAYREFDEQARNAAAGAA